MVAFNDDLTARHKQVIKLAYNWLQTTGYSQSKLAALSGVREQYLSRFLNGDSGYCPAPGRETALGLLEQLEYHLGRYDAIISPSHTEYKDFAESDDGQWFSDFQADVQQYLAAPAPQHLEAVGALVAQAIHGPEDYFIRMIANVGLLLASRLDKPASIATSESRLRKTCERCEILLNTLPSSCPKNNPQAEFHGLAFNYLQYARFFAARHLSSKSRKLASVYQPVEEETLDRVLSRVGEHRSNDRAQWTNIWENAAQMVERKIEDNPDTEWKDRFSQAAINSGFRLMRIVLQNCKVPLLAEYIDVHHPELVGRDSDVDPPASALATIGSILTLWLALSGWGDRLATLASPAQDLVSAEQNAIDCRICVSGNLEDLRPAVPLCCQSQSTHNA